MQDLRVAMIGAGGTAGSLLLEKVNTVVGIAVGVATFIYVVAKIIYLIQDHRAGKKE